MNDVSVSQGTKGPIAVRISSLSQLFNSLDPFPFQERDLDKNAEEFIVGWARELPRDQPIHIVLHLPAAEVQKPECRDVGSGLQKYFNYRAEVTQRELNELFRMGRWSLMIGMTVLAVGLLATQLITGRLGEFATRALFRGRPHHHQLGGQLETAGDFSLRLVAGAAHTQSLSPARECDRRSEALLVGFRVRLRYATLAGPRFRRDRGFSSSDLAWGEHRLPWIEANGVSIHYKLEGTADQTVILLHEIGGSLDFMGRHRPGSCQEAEGLPLRPARVRLVRKSPRALQHRDAGRRSAGA